MESALYGEIEVVNPLAECREQMEADWRVGSVRHWKIEQGNEDGLVRTGIFQGRVVEFEDTIEARFCIRLSSPIIWMNHRDLTGED
jgi:hypothetical protein